MKIVNLETFLALPENVVFAKYVPYAFEELQIKGETLSGGDFLVTAGFSSAIECSNSGESDKLLDNSKKDGASLTMDFNAQGRDGCFEDNQLFSVLEEADIHALIERLKRCLPNKL